MWTSLWQDSRGQSCSLRHCMLLQLYFLMCETLIVIDSEMRSSLVLWFESLVASVEQAPRVCLCFALFLQRQMFPMLSLLIFWVSSHSHSVRYLCRTHPWHIGLYDAGGWISNLPSRQTCGYFCGSNGILWSLVEFQKQSGKVHTSKTPIKGPLRSWFRRWFGVESQLHYFELFTWAAEVRDWKTSLTHVCLWVTCFTQ